jgi:hypothetical protein
MSALTRHEADAELAKHPSWAHCSGCGEMFTSDSAFDRHLGPIPKTGPPPCKDPADVRMGSQRLVYDDTKGAWRWDGQRPVAVFGNTQEAPKGPSRSASKGRAA